MTFVTLTISTASAKPRGPVIVFCDVNDPIPLKPPGPKSMACVAVSGKAVAMAQRMGTVRTWSPSNLVIEPEYLRRSIPGSHHN